MTKLPKKVEFWPFLQILTTPYIVFWNITSVDYVFWTFWYQFHYSRRKVDLMGAITVIFSRVQELYFASKYDHGGHLELGP